MLGGIGGRRRRGQQRIRDETHSMDVSLSELRELMKDKEAWGAAIHGVAKSWTRLSDGTERLTVDLISSEARNRDGVIQGLPWWLRG